MIFYRYLDETTWTNYTAPFVPLRSFIAKIEKTINGVLIVKTEFVAVCGDAGSPSPILTLVGNVLTTTLESGTGVFTMKVNGVDTPHVSPYTANIGDFICVKGTSTDACCTYDLIEACVTVDGSDVVDPACNFELDFNIEVLDGCYSVTRIALPEGILAYLDIFLYKRSNESVWTIMGERETVCSNTVTFRRVLISNLCDTKIKEKTQP